VAAFLKGRCLFGYSNGKIIVIMLLMPEPAAYLAQRSRRRACSKPKVVDLSIVAGSFGFTVLKFSNFHHLAS